MVMPRYDEIQRAEAMDKELVQTKGEYAWARVHAARENIEQMETDMDKVKTKMSGPKDKLMGLHEKLSELKLRKNDLEEQLHEEEEKWAAGEGLLLLGFQCSTQYPVDWSVLVLLLILVGWQWQVPLTHGWPGLGYRRPEEWSKGGSPSRFRPQ